MGVKSIVVNMPSKKPQVSLRLEESEYEELKEWAEAEFRTPAALSAIIIKKTLAQRRVSTKTNSDHPVPDATAILKLLAGGNRPSDGELLEVAQKTGIREEELIQLRDRLFPNGNHQKKGKAANGV